MRKGLILGLLASAVLSLAVSACGGSDDKTETSSDSPQATTAAATTAAGAPAAAATTAPAPAGPQALTVKSGEYYFEPKDFRVRPGAVVVTMTNEGPERPHTFVVKNKSGDGDLAKTERVAQGQVATLEFNVTEEGTYEVYCNLPGHADRGQRGTLTVSRS